MPPTELIIASAHSDINHSPTPNSFSFISTKLDHTLKQFDITFPNTPPKFMDK